MLSRRAFLTGLASGLLAAGPALAQTDRITRGVLRQLEDQGFEIIEVRRTLLGRVRIIARRGGLTRELVLDPRNGLILRDYVSGRGGAGGIPDIGDYDDDDDDDDDEDDDDDDDDGDDGDDDDDGD